MPILTEMQGTRTPLEEPTLSVVPGRVLRQASALLHFPKNFLVVSGVDRDIAPVVGGVLACSRGSSGVRIGGWPWDRR